MKKNTSSSIPVVVPVADLKHEYLFHATIKSCLPTAAAAATTTTNKNNNNKKKIKCNEYVAPPPPSSSVSVLDGNNNNNNNSTKHQPIQRIALLTPPGDLALFILNQMNVIMVQHNNLNSQQKDNAAVKEENEENSNDSNIYDMDVFATSHVPPYGYGKTHGLTKIVRLVSHPLILQVTNALQAVMEPNELESLLLLLEEQDENNNNSNLAAAVVISIMDLKIALRQVLRFHCRLSHVAAHTALLSLDMMNIIQQPINVTNLALRKFLSPLDLQRILHKTTDDDVVEMYVPDDDDNENGDDILGKHDLWDEQERMGTKMLSLVQAMLFHQKEKMTTMTTTTASAAADITSILDQVLMEELQLTKNMTVWPCPSFWAAGDSDENNITILTPLTRRLAKAMSPDCNQNYNDNNNVISSCWVERDKCEAAGNALCQRQ
jgi:hypothetical protein